MGTVIILGAVLIHRLHECISMSLLWQILFAKMCFESRQCQQRLPSFQVDPWRLFCLPRVFDTLFFQSPLIGSPILYGGAVSSGSITIMGGRKRKMSPSHTINVQTTINPSTYPAATTALNWILSWTPLFLALTIQMISMKIQMESRVSDKINPHNGNF